MLYLGAITWIVISAVSIIGFRAHLSTLESSYLKEHIERTNFVQKSIEQKFDQLYLAMLLTSQISAVRDMVQSSTEKPAITSETKNLIRSIFRNLNFNESLLELHILPIVNSKNAYVTEIPIMEDDLSETSEVTVGLKSMDSFEYIEIQKQIKWLHKNFISRQALQGRPFPSIFSQAIFTDGGPTHSEAMVSSSKELNRGVIYTLPIYSIEGKLIGVVSAITFLKGLGEALGSGQFLLYNKDYNVFVKSPELSKNQTLFRELLKQIEVGKSTEQNMKYTFQSGINLKDEFSHNWVLMSSQAVEDFWLSEEVFTAVELLGLRLIFMTFFLVGTFYYIFFNERKEREKVHNIFSKLHGSHVLEVMEQSLKVGGESKEVTVLFADIRGFTYFAEERSPEEVVEMLNEHFASVVSIIQAHGGIVDKFIGDAVMAIWGAPNPTNNGPHDAIMAALEIRKAVHALNDARIAANKTPITIGMGLHCGKAIAGMIGSSEKMEYTVIGATVNAANKIEKATRMFTTDLLISEQIFQKTANKFVVQMVGTFESRAVIDGSMRIYKVLGYRNKQNEIVEVKTPYSEFKPTKIMKRRAS